MTSWVVCDSGLMLATALPENMTPKARALLDAWSRTDIRLAAPKLYAYEIVAAIRKHVYRKSLTPEEGYQVRESLLSKTVELFMDDLLVKRGYDLATHFNRPTAYDSQYLAIAERLECDFWTADERLFNAVHSELSWVKWLGHFGEANNNQG
ncbi:MAG: type II toxin-antitoxin system VapC family toxin [Anaerolineaceae bacterium]|nr:type II toxin-antitoxin system VapC family toxin [Anaerolineaceae bacterium]